MNPILESLHRRKSVRVFEATPVALEDKLAILTAATQAPTAGNQQLYTILDITDPGIKNRLAGLCDNQPFIATAPMVLIFLADCQKWWSAFDLAGCHPRRPGLGDLMLAVSDATIAAQNAVVAAESLGLGSCYIGDIMEGQEDVSALLSLPRYVFPAAMLVMGYPSPQQQTRCKPERCELIHIVHENAYRTMGGTELEAMLAKNAGQRPYADWLDAFCQRKYNSDFSREMTRSVAAYCREFDAPSEG